jgi:hypothetical protein
VKLSKRKAQDFIAQCNLISEYNEQVFRTKYSINFHIEQLKESLENREQFLAKQSLKKLVEEQKINKDNLIKAQRGLSRIMEVVVDKRKLPYIMYK